MGGLSRREFITSVATAAAAAQITSAQFTSAQFTSAQFTSALGAEQAATSQTQSLDQPKLRWLESSPTSTQGLTATVPWPRGSLPSTTTLRVTTKAGDPVPAQSWPIAFWPDASVKWTAHAIPPSATPAASYQVAPGNAVLPPTPIAATDAVNQPIEIDTGIIQCRIPRSGSSIIESVARKGKTILANARLICLRQDQPDDGDDGTTTRESFTSDVTTASIENTGPVRTVVKIEGTHKSANGRSLLPFVVRLYLYAGSDEIRLIHSFVFDADEKKDFLCGIGVRFDVPMSDAMHDRHVRFIGDEHGLFAEGIRTLTGLRRDPGEQSRKAQIDGLPTPPVSSMAPTVGSHLDLIPAWGDFTLSQLSADGFQIRKRTKAGYGWIAAGAGKRSGGAGYIGGVSGGVAFGIRDFWQKHPAQLDIRNAQSDQAHVTLWLWSPDAPAMDLRFYHDGLGQDTYAKQRDGLDITYEDYEPGYASPYGIARTSELKLRALAATPSRESLVEFADALRLPPMLVCEPQRYLDAQVFGALWTLPDKSTPAKSLIEDQLAFYLDRYLKEIDQRSWYGFWDYGDVRHTYDTDRHVWRYDIGGFAWDNSELSTDLWLWYSFLRTGRADVFRMAEAMTRHTGEVDVYHIGPHKGLGTRHGVQHWGDSSKQTRISSALFRRPLFYLTADERIGDLLRNQLTEGETWLTNDVTRKLGGPPMQVGTRAAANWGALSWGELASAWLTEIERTQNSRLQDCLLASMKSIAAMPLGFFTLKATMDLDTGVVTPLGNAAEYEHLTAVFGLPEICNELVRTYGNEVPAFADIWAMYGDIYNGSRVDRQKAIGINAKSAGLSDAHSRCTAFAAWHRQDAKLATRAWREWLDGQTVSKRRASMAIRHVEGPAVLSPVDEADMSTNNTAQFSLAAIQNLALAGNAVEITG
jgi:hypothetical protein